MPSTRPCTRFCFCVFSIVSHPSPFYPASLCMCIDIHFSVSYIIFFVVVVLLIFAGDIIASAPSRDTAAEKEKDNNAWKMETGDSLSCFRTTSPAHTYTHTHVQDSARTENSHIIIRGVKRGKRQSRTTTKKREGQGGRGRRRDDAQVRLTRYRYSAMYIYIYRERKRSICMHVCVCV